VTVSGGNANALIDERATLLTRLARLVGAESRPRQDGAVDVMVGGNALVRGDTAHHVAVHGAGTLDALVAWDPAAPATPAQGPVRLIWAEAGITVGATGGRLGGLLTALAPAGTSGPGGPLATIAGTFDDLAVELAALVNAAHAGGLHLDSDPAVPDPVTDFFTVSTDPADGPPALNLQVNVTDVRRIRAAAPGAGALDGSVADAVSQLAGTLGAAWSQTVVNIGVQTRTAGERAAAAAATFDVASGLLQSRTGVNLDEETLALMASQRAYEGAARVVTAIDQLLDTLINRTGVVGR
jgi:flagellar hook-associated protein 1 FlgK